MRVAFLIAFLTAAAGLSRLLLGPEEVCGRVDAGCVERTRRPATLAPGARARPRSVAVREGGVSVSGHVIGAGGRPVAGARVRVFDWDDELCASTATDGEGAFSLDGAYWDGEIRVDAGKLGRAETYLEAEDRSDIRLGLIPAAALDGCVRAPDGVTPVAGAKVWFSETDFGEGETRTRSDGTFTLSSVPTSTSIQLHVYGGAAGRKHSRTIRWAQDAQVEVILDPVRAVRGCVVTEAEGGGMQGVSGVIVRARESGGRGGEDAVTDEDGAFVCHVLECEGYLEVRSLQWYMPERKVPLAGKYEFELLVCPRFEIDLRCLRADGTPVGGAEISVSDAMAVPSTCDEEGNFTVAGAGPEGITVTARKGGYVGTRGLDVSPAPGRRLNVWLRPVPCITGRVLDERGSPCGHVWVWARFQAEPTDEAEPPPDDELETADAEGCFRFTGLREGRWKLEIEAGGFERETRDASAVAGGNDAGDIHLRRLRRYTGRLVDPAGAPLPGGAVEVEDVAGRWIPVRLDGSFRIAVPEDPASSLYFRAPGHVGCSFDLAELPAGRPWTIVLEPCPTIEGVVLGPDGDPLRSAFVVCKGTRTECTAEASTDLAGAFCVELDEAGTYEVSVRAAAMSFPDPIRVVAGTRGLTLGARALPMVAGRVVGPGGEGLAGVEVRSREGSGATACRRRTLTDKDGRFRFPSIEAEATDLVAAHLPDGLIARRLDDVPAGECHVVIEAVTALSIEGHLTGALDGFPGAYGVVVKAVGHDAPTVYVTMHPDGVFQVDQLLPGLYEVRPTKQIGRGVQTRGEPMRVYAGTDGLVFVLE